MQENLVEALSEKYELLAKIGQGGMGEVYKAKERLGDRVVALKCLSGRNVSSPVAKERLKREFLATEQLDHPNIVKAYELLEFGEELLVMSIEFIEGAPLSSLIHDSTELIEIELAVLYLGQIVSALEYAHTKKIVHRDLKPANILITPNSEIKLLDFGLATFEEKASDLTQTNDAIGTLYYMSPEQFRGEVVDRRTDIYALGVLSYELLAGERPFDSDMPFSVFVEHALGSLPSLRAKRAEIPVWLDIFVQICVEKEPDNRYQDVGEIAELFQDMAQQKHRGGLLYGIAQKMREILAS